MFVSHAFVVTFFSPLLNLLILGSVFRNLTQVRVVIFNNINQANVKSIQYRTTTVKSTQVNVTSFYTCRGRTALNG